MSLISASAVLFLVLDPVGNMPVFLSLLGNLPRRRQIAVITREMLLALVTLLLFLFSGRYITALLDISQPSLSISGGIVLFIIAVRMIFAQGSTLLGELPEGEPFLVPLAIPSIAGPGAMTTLMLLMARAPQRWHVWLTALLLAWCAAGAVLILMPLIARLLGVKGMAAAQRLMGMVLITVAVEMFLQGIGFPRTGPHTPLPH